MAKKKRKKRRGRVIPFILIFLVGLGIMLYPQISRIYYRVSTTSVVSDFDKEAKKLVPEEVKRRMELAHAYNASLTGSEVKEDPYSEEKKEEGRKEYARMLEINEQIGHVEVPKMNQDIPIYAGTSETVLQKGVGHLEGTSLPVGGNSTHAVLTAHSALPTAKLFTDLLKMEKGDKFYVHNMSEILAYQVDQIKVIEPSDFSDLLISPGHDYCTLLTCTPLMINTHRLIVRGHRVPYVPEVEKRIIAANKQSFLHKYLFYGFSILAILLVILDIFLFVRRRRLGKRILRLRKKMKKLSMVEEVQDEEKE